MTNTETTEPVVKLPTSLTGYQVHKLTNKALKDAGFDKEIPAQMVYSYIKQGFIKSITVGNQTRVETKVAVAWIKKYIDRKIQAKAELDLLEAEIGTTPSTEVAVIEPQSNQS